MKSCIAAALALGLALAVASPSQAQPYARFAVADSLLPRALRSSGTGFEAAWNALLVAGLRAQIARADSALDLQRLASRVATAETATLGTTIARDALTLRVRWNDVERLVRIRGAIAESLGAIALASRRFAEADTLYHSALDSYRRLRETRRAAWMLGTIGLVAFQAQDYPRADSLYRDALVARRALGDARMLGATLNSLGATNVQLHRPSVALPFLIEARAVRERMGDSSALAATLNALSLVYDDLGQPDSAAVIAHFALVSATAAGDSARVLEVVNRLSRRYNAAGDPEAALACADRGLRLARERGDASSEASVEQQRGLALTLQGRFAEAAAAFENALALYLALDDPRGELAARVQLGRQAVQLEDAKAARGPLERAIVLADSLRDFRESAFALNDLAIACRLEADSVRARTLAERALGAALTASDSGLVHDTAVTLGQIASDRGDFAAAIPWFRRARGALGSPSADRSIGDEINLGTALARSGTLDEAQSHFEGAERLARQAGATELLWPAWLGLGDVAERRGQVGAALAWDRRAATLIDTLRSRQGAEGTSIVLLSRRLFAFEALIHLLGKLAPQFPDSAFDAEGFTWAERTRARAFLDVLNAQGRSAERLEPVNIARARDVLPSARAALLEYSLGDSSSCLWVVTKREWKRISLPPRAMLQARAEILRRSLADPEAAESRSARTAARALDRLLIAPAEPLLKNVDELVIAPDGALAQIPFEALLSADAPEGAPVPRGAYLVERYAISYTPSATTLASALETDAVGAKRVPDSRRRAASAGAQVLAIGAPVFGPIRPEGHAAALAPLPSTADELSALRALASTGRCDVLSGRSGTRDSVLGLPMLRTAEILHIATHGEANAAMPERSGLWLSAAADTVPPGFVSMRDILALSLRARLVTLSACETGLGRLERGEGVIGLARAFLAAGARSVVVSLWSVNDRSTAELMRRFYTPLIGRGESRTLALAQAKRALLAGAATRSPFYWAPFVLIGASGTLE